MSVWSGSDPNPHRTEGSRSGILTDNRDAPLSFACRTAPTQTHRHCGRQLLYENSGRGLEDALWYERFLGLSAYIRKTKPGPIHGAKGSIAGVAAPSPSPFHQPTEPRVFSNHRLFTGMRSLWPCCRFTGRPNWPPVRPRCRGFNLKPGSPEPDGNRISLFKVF